MPVCPSVSGLIHEEDGWMDFDEILYERYATGGHPQTIRIHFLQTAITKRRKQELVKCARQ
jgi:hypothetical protein